LGPLTQFDDSVVKDLVQGIGCTTLACMVGVVVQRYIVAACVASFRLGQVQGEISHATLNHCDHWAPRASTGRACHTGPSVFLATLNDPRTILPVLSTEVKKCRTIQEGEGKIDSGSKYAGTPMHLAIGNIQLCCPINRDHAFTDRQLNLAQGASSIGRSWGLWMSMEEAVYGYTATVYRKTTATGPWC
jgi:hypothetical protein